MKRFCIFLSNCCILKENNEKEQAYGGRKREEINETGSIELTHNNRKHNIQLLTIIGEIEGHEAVSGNTKATK